MKNILLQISMYPVGTWLKFHLYKGCFLNQRRMLGYCGKCEHHRDIDKVVGEIEDFDLLIKTWQF